MRISKQAETALMLPTMAAAAAQEFFQLLMRELFDPQYGMFVLEDNTRTYYFRASGLELHMEFELVGLLLALAIYNGHTLEVAFPRVVYKCAPPGTLCPPPHAEQVHVVRHLRSSPVCTTPALHACLGVHRGSSAGRISSNSD